MAKICEYDEVKCPFCGSGEVEHYTYGRVHYSSMSATSITVNVHVVRCKACSLEFAIPCED